MQVSFEHMISLNAEMEKFEREEEINHLVNTLIDGMNDETLMDYDCTTLDSNEEIMDEKVNSLGCHYSDISSPGSILLRR